MSGKKIRVGILFGGQSAEHEISLLSARNVLEALDRHKYEAVLIGIDREGRWHLGERSALMLEAGAKALPHFAAGGKELVLLPGGKAELMRLDGEAPAEALDVVFPVLHGPFGEDGTVQGLLKLSGVPFVGAGVLGSAVGMDKDVMKRLLNQAGISTARFLVFHDCEGAGPDFLKVTAALGLPVFVKPANLGSSVGIHKVIDKKSFERAVDDAFRYDRKILVEEAVRGRELECAVLGNERPEASLPGEVIPKHEFYSYEAKYLDENGAAFEIPARLDEAATRRIQEMAVAAFKALCCEGMARVDFFLRPDGALLVNEINTIPGFTRISMYPRMWEASGLPMTELVDRLIQLALERHEKEKGMRTKA
jgi:D-alanine-D-alanine ligase